MKCSVQCGLRVGDTGMNYVIWKWCWRLWEVEQVAETRSGKSSQNQNSDTGWYETVNILLLPGDMPQNHFVKIRFRGGFWSEWWSITARLYISASPTDQTRWQIFTCNSKMCNYSGMCLLEVITLKVNMKFLYSVPKPSIHLGQKWTFFRTKWTLNSEDAQE